MSQGSQAELFARSFQSQVARNPGAACLTLPVLRALGAERGRQMGCVPASIRCPTARSSTCWS